MLQIRILKFQESGFFLSRIVIIAFVRNDPK